MPLFLYPPYSEEVKATGDITTTSGSAVLATGMTITPGAGTYLVWFSADIENSSNKAAVFLSIFAAGAEEAERENWLTDKNDRYSGSVHAKVTVDAGEAIEGRWRRNSGTATMGNRSLMIKEVFDA